MARRTGILGGTFNPPHIGHVAIARAAADALALDVVVWIPVAGPPLKDAEGDPGALVRLELCRIAAREDERFEVSDLEVERGGVSYTAATLEALHDQHPEDDLSFIVGADAALTLPRWQRPERVLELARLAVAERGGIREPQVREAMAGIEGAAKRIDFFSMAPVDVSSTKVREAAAAGRPLDGVVPGSVAEEIRRRGLYRQVVSA